MFAAVYSFEITRVNEDGGWGAIKTPASFLCSLAFFCFVLLRFCAAVLARRGFRLGSGVVRRKSLGFGVSLPQLSYGCPRTFRSLVVCEASSQVLSKWWFLLHGDGHGARVIVAAAVDNGANHLYYRAASTFVASYSCILPLGRVFRWDFKKDVVAWLNSVVYHSFVRHIGQHIGRCWYVLDVPAPEFTGPTELQDCVSRLFGNTSVEDIKIKMGTHAWVIPFADGRLDRIILGQFVAVLELDVFDCVFVAVSTALELQVIVFGNDNAERVYQWISCVHPT